MATDNFLQQWMKDVEARLAALERAVPGVAERQPIKDPGPKR